MTKSERKLELDKLKEMSTWGERVTYILTYYHIPIIIAVVAVAISSWIGVTIYRVNQDTLLYFVSINQPKVTPHTITTIDDQFAERCNVTGKKEVLSFEVGLDYSEMSNEIGRAHV